MSNLEKSLFWLIAGIIFVTLTPRTTAGYIVGGAGGLICGVMAIYLAFTSDWKDKR